MNILKYSDYRPFLRDCFSERKSVKKSDLATYLNCQPGFISQVLSETKTHFTSEHIIKAAEFFNLSADETHFLFLLLQYSKAGSTALAKHLKGELDHIRRKHESISAKIDPTEKTLGEAQKAIYYSHWSYMVVHMAISLPELQTADRISKRLGLDLKHVKRVLKFLVENKLVESSGGKFTLGKTRIHLEAESPYVLSLHQNFRNLASSALAKAEEFNLHYSSVLALSRQDALEIKEMILKLIKDKEKILIPSKEEELVVLNLDYFIV